MPEGDFDVLPDETRVIVSEGDDAETAQLHTIDLVTGERVPLGRVGVSPRMSPDGERIAYVHKTGPLTGRVMIAPLSGGAAASVSGVGGGGTVRLVAWSPDGRRIAVGSHVSGGLIEVVEADGDAVREIYRSERLWLMNGSMTLVWKDDGHLLTQIQTDVEATDVVEIAVDQEIEPRAIASLPAGGGDEAVRSGHSVVWLATTVAKDVWVTPVGEGGALGAAHRLSPDDRAEALVGWSGEAVAYRNMWGAEPLVLHRPDEPYGDVVMPAASWGAVVLSDRAVLFPEGAPPLSTPFGQPMPTLEGPRMQVRCGSGACVTARAVGDYLTWSTVDPVTGAVGEPFARLENLGPQLRWSIGVDGSTILVTCNLEWTRSHAVGAREWRPIELPPGFRVQFASAGVGGTIWATGVTDEGWALARFAPDLGWSEPALSASWVANPLPSPDGRYVAYDQMSFDNDLWSITPP